MYLSWEISLLKQEMHEKARFGPIRITNATSWVSLVSSIYPDVSLELLPHLLHAHTQMTCTHMAGS